MTTNDNDWNPCDGEITRLRWWLGHIVDARGAHSVDLREMAANALAGDAQGVEPPAVGRQALRRNDRK